VIVNQVIVGDARHIPLPDGSVHLVVTSPPYWSLRDYGVAPSVWGGDDPECRHEWGSSVRSVGGQGGRSDKQESNAGSRWDASSGQFCRHCGAWLGCLGLEPDFRLFITHIVEVMREVRRVLRADGVCALNLGSSYATGAKEAAGPRPKSNLLIPHRVAIALEDDGWIVRQDVPALKRAAMPESVGDRFTTAHEYIFHLTKEPSYWWDADAIRRAHLPQSIERSRYAWHYSEAWTSGAYPHGGGMSGMVLGAVGRNFRTTDLVLDEHGEPLVYLWHPEPFSGAHFSTFPCGLVEPWIKAACPPKCCPTCGRGWIRVVLQGEPVREWQRACGSDHFGRYRGSAVKEYQGTGAQDASDVKRRILAGMRERTSYWQPQCAHHGAYPFIGLAWWKAWHFVDPSGSLQEDVPTIPGLAVDPFAGSGTVGIVAARLGRRFVGVEVKREYAVMAQERIGREGFAVSDKPRSDGGYTQPALF